MLLLLSHLALAQDTSWVVEVGADLQTTPHGLLTVAASRGPWTLGLYTDTLELRLAPELDGGRAWLAARTELGIAGLMATPWQDGAPAPESAVYASYSGLESGRIWYLRGGLYAGFEARVRVWWFIPGGDQAAPANRPVGTAQGLIGFYRPALHAYAWAGTDAQSAGLAPFAHGRLEARGPWAVSPVAKLYAGVAEHQDEVLRTRLGGLMPFQVPLAGAAWSEFWVEDYAVARLGVGVQAEPGPVALRVDLVTDLAAFDGQTVAGFALDSRTGWGPWHVDLALGYSPWLARPEGTLPGAAWIKVGWNG